MSKNITIQEGSVARTFTAAKLRTGLVSGGTCNWVPEDEAEDYVSLRSKDIDENGTYYAADDGTVGYSSVVVDVKPDVIRQVFTANGTYKASDDGADGYSVVTVKVSGGGGGTDIPVQVTYPAGEIVAATDGTAVLYADDSGYYEFTIPTEGDWLFITSSGNQIQMYVSGDGCKAVFNTTASPRLVGPTGAAGIAGAVGLVGAVTYQ